MSWFKVSIFIVWGAVLLPLVSGGLLATASENEIADNTEEIVFVPPEIGAPKDRMGAGTRGTAPDSGKNALLMLVPEAGGLTTLASPPLIWRLNAGHRGDLVISIIPLGSIGSELRINGPFPPGDYGLDLERAQLQLDTGRIYEWQIQLLKPGSNSVLEQNARLVERVPEDMRSENPASAGIWFDAISPLIEIGLSGRARTTNSVQLDQLLQSAGVGD